MKGRTFVEWFDGFFGSQDIIELLLWYGVSDSRFVYFGPVVLLPHVGNEADTHGVME